MTNAITITYWEGNETKDSPFTRLHYCEWTCNGRHYYAHADESSFNYGEENGDLDEYRDGAGNYEHRGIPLEVRRTLAALIFPPLKDLPNV
jgi:hypothetical protein